MLYFLFASGRNLGLTFFGEGALVPGAAVLSAFGFTAGGCGDVAGGAFVAGGAALRLVPEGCARDFSRFSAERSFFAAAAVALSRLTIALCLDLRPEIARLLAVGPDLFVPTSDFSRKSSRRFLSFSTCSLASPKICVFTAGPCPGLMPTILSTCLTLLTSLGVISFALSPGRPFGFNFVTSFPPF